MTIKELHIAKAISLNLSTNSLFIVSQLHMTTLTHDHKGITVLQKLLV